MAFDAYHSRLNDALKGRLEHEPNGNHRWSQALVVSRLTARATVLLHAGIILAGSLSCTSHKEQFARRVYYTKAPAQFIKHTRAEHRQIDSLHRLLTVGDSFDYWMTAALREVGKYIVVADQRTSPHISVVDTRTWRIASRVGSHGSGAGEMLDASSISRSVNDEHAVWVFDTRLARFSSVEVDATGHARIRRQVVLPTQLPAQTIQTAHTATGIVASGRYGDAALYLIDTIENVTTIVSGPLPFDSSIAKRSSTRQELNRHSFAVAPRSRRIVIAYQHTNRLDFLDSTGMHLGTVYGPREARAHYELVAPDAPFRWYDDTEFAYVDVSATDRFVYALFCGCTKQSRAFAAFVQVFTWQGDLVREYVLDMPVYRLTVLTGDSVLLAPTWNPYPSLGVWALPALPPPAGAP